MIENPDTAIIRRELALRACTSKKHLRLFSIRYATQIITVTYNRIITFTRIRYTLAKY